ncbi:MAG: tyrosine-type recombinase/integrase, partial [bacterium]|nr:tyrosine-type recombinase/integrase [bacterium]
VETSTLNSGDFGLLSLHSPVSVVPAAAVLDRSVVMYSAGLRIGEAITLKPADIDSESMMIRVREGKGNRDRRVMLSPRLLENLRKYWKRYRPKEWLFPGSCPGQPINVCTVQKVFKQAVSSAGIDKKVTLPLWCCLYGAGRFSSRSPTSTRAAPRSTWSARPRRWLKPASA